MAIEFCPLANEVGNLADWFAVGVGAIAAVSTTVVAVLAYRTSERATRIAEEAKGIAEQQHMEAVRLREETARVLGRLLLSEVASLPGRVGMILRMLNRAIIYQGRFRIAKRPVFESAIREARAELMPFSERSQERIHNFPEVLGADLATLIGTCQSLNEVASQVEARAIWVTEETVEQIGCSRLIYDDQEGELLGLRRSAAELLKMSIEVATDFRRFVGVDAYDYSALSADASTVFSGLR
jgi:hypothetical protein